MPEMRLLSCLSPHWLRARFLASDWLMLPQHLALEDSGIAHQAHIMLCLIPQTTEFVPLRVIIGHCEVRNVVSIIPGLSQSEAS